jgi:hypothetical protein
MAHDQEPPPSAEASQSLEDRPLRYEQRSHTQGRGDEARFRLGAEFDRVVDPKKMVKPYVATGATAGSLDRA